MAEGSGLEKLESEVTCPLCLVFFQSPKKLNCDHVYCKECLEGLAKLRKNGTIECPECRILSPIPNNDVNNFPTAFQINRLKDVCETFTKQYKWQVRKVDPNSCKKHRSQTLVMYCETCEDRICRDCVLATDDHKDHNYGYADKIAERIQEELGEKVTPMREMEVSASTALEKVRRAKSEIVSQGELLQQSIEIGYAEIVERLLKEKKTLQDQVADKIDRKTAFITQQAEALEEARTKLRQAVESIEAVRQSAPGVEIITTKDDLTTKAQKAQKNFKSIFLAPCETADVGVEVSAEHLHGQMWKDNSFIYCLADPKKCSVVGAALSYVEVDTTAIIKINIVDSSGKPCTGQQSVHIDLCRIRDGTPCAMQILEQGTGFYEIAFQASSRGRYKLSIEVNGNHISQSPYTIFMAKPPHTITSPLKRITDLKSPSCLTYCENKLIVSNFDHSHISVIDSRGEREDIKVPSYSPTGTALDKDGNFYVCTVRDSKLHKLNKSGQRVKSTITGQFNFPNGSHLSKNEELYVCDSNSDRIRVFNKELDLLRTIPTRSLRAGSPCTPVDVDTDDEGKLYVVEHGNQRIQVLNSDGKQSQIIGSRRSTLLGASVPIIGGQDRLSKPAGMKVFGDYVYVADWAYNCVFVFSKSGQAVNSFGSEVLNHPEGLTIDDDGYVYVASGRKDVIVF